MASVLSQLRPAAEPEHSLAGSPRGKRARPDLAIRFPPRYRGVFERDQHHSRAGAGQISLGPEARVFIARRFGPAASDLVTIVERMAAAAAAGDPRAD